MRFLFLLFITISLNTEAQELNWITDFTKAKKLATKEGKLILMRFTGSDWCANCIRIDTTLIETQPFIEFAKDRYVFLYLDFPSKAENKLSKRQESHNQELLEKYNPSKSFPALLVLSPKGEVLGQMNVRPNTTQGYIDILAAFN